MSVGLSGVADGDLEALLSAIERGELRVPFSPATLQSRGLGHVCEALEPYLALDLNGLRAVLEVVLADRRHRKSPRLGLVWTGEDPGVSHSRYTRVVLPELFARAQRHILIAGYAFDQGAEVLGKLHEALARGVTCDLFVDIDQQLERLKGEARRQRLDWAALTAPLSNLHDPAARGRAVIALFFRLLWPFGDPRPAIWFDPRTAERFTEVSLHAKCVVVDHELTLITSANFTGRGQTRNLEAGVTIEDRAFAASLERQWSNLMQAGLLERA